MKIPDQHSLRKVRDGFYLTMTFNVEIIAWLQIFEPMSGPR